MLRREVVEVALVATLIREIAREVVDAVVLVV